MRYDALQIWMLTITFVAPVLIGASSGEFMKAVALAASSVFLANLLFGTLFGGWDGLGGMESRMLASASTVPLSVPLGAAGFGLRRIWLHISHGHGLGMGSH
jgi:hypothetical protein